MKRENHEPRCRTKSIAIARAQMIARTQEDRRNGDSQGGNGQQPGKQDRKSRR